MYKCKNVLYPQFVKNVLKKAFIKNTLKWSENIIVLHQDLSSAKNQSN